LEIDKKQNDAEAKHVDTELFFGKTASHYQASQKISGTHNRLVDNGNSTFLEFHYLAAFCEACPISINKQQLHKVLMSLGLSKRF
jgi:hypothetical protein